MRFIVRDTNNPSTHALAMTVWFSYILINAICLALNINVKISLSLGMYMSQSLKCSAARHLSGIKLCLDMLVV